MNPLSFAAGVLHRQVRKARYRSLHRRFRDFSMIPASQFVENLFLAERVRSIPGCVVECGVWRGGMSAALATVLGPERSYFLFDSFEGLPPARDLDGEEAIRWQAEKNAPTYHDNCTAGPEFAREAMARSGARKYELVKGWFEQTVPTFCFPGPIALLRLDGDWYDSTMVCLEHLFPQVAPNGLVIVDDYFSWDGCSRAVHDFLSRRSAAERVRSLGETCFVQKQPSAVVPAVSVAVPAAAATGSR